MNYIFNFYTTINTNSGKVEFPTKILFTPTSFIITGYLSNFLLMGYLPI